MFGFTTALVLLCVRLFHQVFLGFHHAHLHCAFCALTVCVKYSYFGAYHNIFCEMSHIATTLRMSHSHTSSESYIVE